jgi:hypothetical protein
VSRPPVFIVGAPRSGTSLLRQMLNRHPELAICNETHFLRIICKKGRREAFGDLGNRANRQRLVNEYVSLRPMQRLGVDCTRLAERLVQEGTSYQALFTSVLRYYAESQGKRRFGEKTPRHALFVDTLCEWFPGAVILHIVRDPRDVVASLLRMPFGSRSVVLNARLWLRLNLAARRSSHLHEYLEVRYEALVIQPEQELTRICTFIGEEYSPAMLTPEQPAVTDDSWRNRYQTPLTTSRVNQWRRELTPEQVAQIEWAVGPHLERFGYAREAPPASILTIVRGVSFAAFVKARRAIATLPALWYGHVKPMAISKHEYWMNRKAWAANEQAVRGQT